MLKSLHLQNLTVFPDAEFLFGKNLNVILGENGSGKSHVLKAAYCAIAVSAQGRKDGSSDPPTKGFLATALATKLSRVFMPDALGRLASRRQGRATCHCSYSFAPESLNLGFSFSTASTKEVVVDKLPTSWAPMRPVFLPTRELLTISPGFVSLYETTYLPFEETWRDTCLLLGAPLARGPRLAAIKQLLQPLEQAMGGKVELDKAGRFYLNVASGSMEMHLVAEGLRKLATLARLIATGSLLGKGYLFWDEPESNLNPRIIKTVAKTILQLAKSGIQVFIATHSLFLMRELHILQQQRFQELDTRCFGLHLTGDGTVSVKQGKTMDAVGSIAALDEDLEQADRYIDTEMGLPLTADGSEPENPSED